MNQIDAGKVPPLKPPQFILSSHLSRGVSAKIYHLQLVFAAKAVVVKQIVLAGSMWGTNINNPLNNIGNGNILVST